MRRDYWEAETPREKVERRFNERQRAKSDERGRRLGQQLQGRLLDDRRLGWGVVRVNDDGRIELVNDRMCWAAADKVAGALRDQSQEQEIADGWNYLPRKLTSKVSIPRRRRPGGQ